MVAAARGRLLLLLQLLHVLGLQLFEVGLVLLEQVLLFLMGEVLWHLWRLLASAAHVIVYARTVAAGALTLLRVLIGISVWIFNILYWLAHRL